MARDPVVCGAGVYTNLHWVFPIRTPLWSSALGGCLTSSERLGRRGLQTAVVKFTMSWTSEQNYTHWGGSLERICSRLRTDKVSCTTGVRESINLHQERKCLYYFQHLIRNYLRSAEDLLWLHGELGISILK